MIMMVIIILIMVCIKNDDCKLPVNLFCSEERIQKVKDLRVMNKKMKRMKVWYDTVPIYNFLWTVKEINVIFHYQPTLE